MINNRMFLWLSIISYLLSIILFATASHEQLNEGTALVGKLVILLFLNGTLCLVYYGWNEAYPDGYDPTKHHGNEGYDRPSRNDWDDHYD